MADEPSTSSNRTADFVNRYANQVTFELNTSDLRIVFGNLEKNAPSKYHTAITVTWAEAKILRYLLSQNIAVYEAFEGKVYIPPGMLPSAPPDLKPEQKDDARAQTIHEAMVNLHSDLLADQGLDGEAAKN